MSACSDHECDQCETCRAGSCCGEMVYDANLPEQGSWPGKHHAPLGELVEVDGLVQCHACSWKGHALFSHIKTHKMTSEQYKAYFGLNVTARLSSAASAKMRGRDLSDVRSPSPPSLTREQRQTITIRREQRLQSLKQGRYDASQQRHYASLLDHSSDSYRASIRKARRKHDDGHHCPSCGAWICTWTGRASGISTQRVLCGEPECARAAKRNAAAIANRRRFSVEHDG